jgi:hypothetical protein
MFIRFRQRKNRLQVSLLETSRLDAKVRNEHVASFGSVELPLTVEIRIAFWQALHDRFGKLANRVDAAAQAKLFSDIHAKIPMVMLDEQRELQLRNAESDRQLWKTMRGLAEDRLAGHQKLADLTRHAINDSKPAVKEADERVASAQSRIDRLKNGEALSGGLGKPRTREELISLMGLRADQARQMMEVAELSDIIGFKVMSDEITKSIERAKIATVSRLLRAKRANGFGEP